MDLVVGVSSRGLTVFCGEGMLTSLNHFPWYCMNYYVWLCVCMCMYMCVCVCVCVLKYKGRMSYCLVYRVRIAAVNFKGKQLLLEMMPPPVRTR